MATVDPERFRAWFDELAAIGRSDSGWQRLAWTPLEAEARRWFTEVAGSIGLDVRQDGAGTLWAVTSDADEAPWVCAGSHLDTQPDGGAFDGALGVVSALAAAEAILRSGAPRRRPLAVAAFVDEEGARFRTPTFASLAITGGLDVDATLEMMGDAPAIYGVTRSSLLESRAQLERIACFLEVHVEQGRRLAPLGAALGVADRLRPRQRWLAELHGQADHAGTTPMEDRHDALAAAARLVLAVEEEASARPGTVGTVGRLEIEPGSSNSIAGRVVATIDLRSPAAAAIDEVIAELRRRFANADLRRISQNAGVRFDDDLRARLFAAASACGATAVDCPSYAGHDAGILAPHRPAAMLFVRNPAGHSHTPLETASPEDCLLGAQTLATSLAGLVT
jgi:beta-ureidopropionase / N-carbamoyl-L-amino-acid hydrolase